MALAKNLTFDFDFNNIDLIDEQLYSDDKWDGKLLDLYINLDIS